MAELPSFLGIERHSPILARLYRLFVTERAIAWAYLAPFPFGSYEIRELYRYQLSSFLAFAPLAAVVDKTRFKRERLYHDLDPMSDDFTRAHKRNFRLWRPEIRCTRLFLGDFVPSLTRHSAAVPSSDRRVAFELVNGRQRKFALSPGQSIHAVTAILGPYEPLFGSAPR